MEFQTKITDKFNSFTLSNLPHAVLLEGEFGCGRHLLLKELASRLNVELVDITAKLDTQSIYNYQLRLLPSFFVIDCDKLTIKEQNQILKFIEEPNCNIYIFLLTENRANIIDTVLNRCIQFKFEPYTKEQLSTFCNDNNIIQYANTPGQVLLYKDFKLENLSQLCDQIFTQISKATVPNALSLVNKINWKSDSDKYDRRLFYYNLIDSCRKLVALDNRYIQAYLLTQKLLADSTVLHIDQKRLFEAYLINLKTIQMQVQL